jgi:Mg-chelatase subunit ChlD
LLQAIGEVGKDWYVNRDDESMATAAVWAVAHNIDPYDMLPIEHSDAAAFAKFFEMNIAVAVNDSDGAAAVELALEMAVQHELRKPPPPPEPPPPGDGTGNGTGQGQGEEPADDAGVDDEPDTLNHPDSDGIDDDDDVHAEPASTESATEPAPEQTMEERYVEIKENITKDFQESQKKALRRDRTRVRNLKKEGTAEAALGNAQLSFVGDHRIVIYPEPEQQRFNLPSGVVDIPSNLRGMETSYRYTGTVSNKTWQMAIGNMRTFSRTTQSRTRIGILMDISGSMGCACNMCVNGLLERAPNIYGITNSAAIGYAVAGAVSELDTDAVVATYAGYDEIYRIKPGHVLTHEAYGATGGSTPTCVALEWLEKSMAEDLSDAFCLLITDGYPNVCSAGQNPTEHTNAIAWRMYESGVQFGVVVVGRYSANITANLPPTVTVNISRFGELDKLQEIVNAIAD